MGQGQEIHARRLLSQSMAEGGWVLLQNCHLGLDYMDELLDTITTTEFTHQSFRCWITTEVHPKFPINLLQVSPIDIELHLDSSSSSNEIIINLRCLVCCLIFMWKLYGDTVSAVRKVLFEVIVRVENNTCGRDHGWVGRNK